MNDINITMALKILEPLQEALEAAYWDSHEVNIKDHIFELITSVQHETSELAKLSVSDMDLPYEPITEGFSSSCKQLKRLFNRIENDFPRKQTADKLRQTLPVSANLLNACSVH